MSESAAFWDVRLKQAKAEGSRDCQKTHIALEDKWHRAGYQDGIEKAAKIAERNTCDLGAPCSFTAQEIRALLDAPAREEKK